MLPPHDPAAGPAFELRGDGGPLVATAVHAGHVIRPELAGHLAVTRAERRAREDPFSDRWATAVGDATLLVHRSRFECDLDRPRVASVYRGGGDAWGLDVWSRTPAPAVLGRSLALHDAFYAALERVLVDTTVRYESFALLDFHAADAAGGPLVDVDTAGGLRGPWASSLQRFVDALADQEVEGRRLDVGIDPPTTGGHLVRWVNERFGTRGFAAAVTVEKRYLDPETGELRPDLAAGIEGALSSAAADLADALAVA